MHAWSRVINMVMVNGKARQHYIFIITYRNRSYENTNYCIHAGKDENWTQGIQSNPANSNSQGKRRIVQVNPNPNEFEFIVYRCTFRNK
jgi:hypothetical protein